MLKSIRAVWNRFRSAGFLQWSGDRITDRDIEAVKRINLIAYLEGLGYRPHWRNGDRAVFLSPLREENNPSFGVSHYKGVWTWKDWGTGEHGDIIEFVERYSQVGFLDAVRTLRDGCSAAAAGGGGALSGERMPSTDDGEKKEWVRRFYHEGFSLLGDRGRDAIRRYFKAHGVKYYPEMGCICYTSFKEKKLYLAVPIPNPASIKGLECREMKGTSRKTLGHKTLWDLKRDTSRVLVAESILDALAGEIILGDHNMTLCSTNGVGNIEKIGEFVRELRPKEVLFALDNDEAGRKAQERGIEIVKSLCSVRIIDHHTKADVKDLHKLLMPLAAGCCLR